MSSELRPKIFTYYEDLGAPYQQQLVDVWYENWLSKGFHPVVLSKKDVLSHPYAMEFETEMSMLNYHIMGKHSDEYGMSCYLRWLAYANQNEGPCFVSDYDVINVSLEPHIPSDQKLELYDNVCPCFASGTSELFEKLCRSMVERSHAVKDEIKGKVESHYNDQEVFLYSERYYKDDCDFIRIDEREPDERLIQGYDYERRGEQKIQSKVVHFAHSCMGQAEEKYPENFEDLNHDQMRFALIKDILS